MWSENMASLGGGQIISTKDLTDSVTKDKSCPTTVEKKVRDREDKFRLAKERQNEERQRKIEELRAQAEAAQKYREQKEEERRRRIEELKHKENDRRHQVEERKKAIMEAEKERREYILRKNQEREARLDTRRKNEKGSIVFAFGSSTPRLLDPTEFGAIFPSTYWGHRRSTSITNVAYTGGTATRRSSERELADGPKKRATSAGGIDRQNDDHRPNISTSMYEVFNWGCSIGERPQRHPLSLAAVIVHVDGVSTHEKSSKSFKEESVDSPPVSYRSVYRRKTDLMPTIPSPRDSSFGSRNSLYSHTPRTPGSRSGDVTPSGSVNTSRPVSAMSNTTTVCGVVQRRSGPPARKLRPVSIAVTGVSINNEVSKQKKEKPPLPKVQSTPKRVKTSSGPLNNKKNTSLDKSIEGRSSLKKDSSQKAKTLFQSSSNESVNNSSDLFEANTKKSATDVVENAELRNETEPTAVTQTKEEKEALNTVKCESSNLSINATNIIKEVKIIETSKTENQEVEEGRTDEKIDNETEKAPRHSKKPKITRKEQEEVKKLKDTKDQVETMDEFKILSYQARDTSAERQENDMTASMIARKITTEEEAKAALAERRRLAREEAERQAEVQRQRIESERHAELRWQAEEEERQRKLEEETLRLAKEQRKAEEERLLLAIQEAKKREEIEKFKREEEEKFKAEREEAERKAKEEAEKQRVEIAERLKREEKEREERRKRVEAIMSRTRAKGGNSNPNSSTAKDVENTKDSIEQLAKSDEQLSEMQIASNNTNVEKNFSSDRANNIFSTEMIRNDTRTKINSYEQSVTAKENDLIKCFMHMMTDEQQHHQSPQILNQEQQNVTKILPNLPNTFVQVTNGILEEQKNNQSNDILVQVIAHSNGHTENLNKNATNDLVDFMSAEVTELSESQARADVNFYNKNLLTPSTPLVTSDSHDNTEIPLL